MNRQMTRGLLAACGQGGGCGWGAFAIAGRHSHRLAPQRGTSNVGPGRLLGQAGLEPILVT